ncbi:DUF885 domain-containing protein [Aquimarina gracilis]|uniref:DUF885 domain-containing protein n=1 Tax=Aquimarina gracilis TaxID=874422 RepID=A0ABU5ZRV9_9FLAO|nr:DUF885 domain-containing protein [Aquimarina gracilis]MEB3344526.1 DUF885 domain-containing protein [Aquimarina gracilis]
MKTYLVGLSVIFILTACNKKSETQEQGNSIIKLADVYYQRVLESYPEYAYYLDEDLGRHDQISSNDLLKVEEWERFEDSLYLKLREIDESIITEKKNRITYWLLKEELESNKAMRVCKRNLWNVNHRSGWQSKWLSLINFQPVGSEELREQALTRWNTFPDYVATEIKNLKKGVALGYTMPKEIVKLVIDQMQVLQDYTIKESPFMSPAKRDGDEDFVAEWKALVDEKMLPAIANYQKYLSDEYLKVAREEVSILNIPNGAECYQAQIRSYTTSGITGNEIFELGSKIVKNNKTKVIELGKELYKSDNFNEIVKLVEEDSLDYFKTSDEILETNIQLLENAKKESEKWFAVMPSKEVTIKPYEPHEAGRGSYEGATKDKPAYFRINLQNPEKQQKGSNEILTYHEAYPGHHLQRGIERDIVGLHPISKMISFGSYVEGWARYSEQLAEEMNLYKNRSALIKRRTWPSRGMVVDPALHLKGWTKEQVMNFMMESGTTKESALSLYHRIIIWPAQLTSYDVGGEEIKSLRKRAESKLGDDFDVREFHSEVLKNGSIPLSALRISIDDWIDKKSSKL